MNKIAAVSVLTLLFGSGTASGWWDGPVGGGFQDFFGTMGFGIGISADGRARSAYSEYHAYPFYRKQVSPRGLGMGRPTGFSAEQMDSLQRDVEAQRLFADELIRH